MLESGILSNLDSFFRCYIELLARCDVKQAVPLVYLIDLGIRTPAIGRVNVFCNLH